MSIKIDKIRNFSIIAHIDHGKSTLADRLLQFTGAISDREFRNQVLDDMDLERERGITIKARAVRIAYKGYWLNLIDTPGHVDFTYEVAKSLAACEGALLLVDAAQGVEAQTVSTLHLALEHNLKIIPIINKIDLINADPERVKRQLKDVLNIETDQVILASAKEGIGTEEVLDAVVSRIPAPKGKKDSSLQALIFDSKFDVFKGVVVYLRVMKGCICPRMKIKFMSTGSIYEVEEVGVFTPRPCKVDELACGQVGYISCNIKETGVVSVGDTITNALLPCKERLPGYKKLISLVFSSLYPVNSKDHSLLREGLAKLKLNDAGLVYEPESSASLGLGFRCGFLGLLHMEIVQERLEREFDLNLITTAPSVTYQIKEKDGRVITVDDPSKFPPNNKITQMFEPYIRAFMIIPKDSLGAIMELSHSRRGVYKGTEYLDVERVLLTYELPLSEILVDFYDKIKSITRGYGSLDYEFIGYFPTALVKLDILINGEICENLSSIVYKKEARARGQVLAGRLKQLIPRQLFEVVIQAAIGSQVITRESVRPLGKHVTGKCYGGDITRKRKLWEKQKAGKKRMKQFGKVKIPQEAFMAILTTK
ncbi:MAG: translation elongation factor 4 [Candidatus Omnitrophota bacterium]|nr:translation elongation factor 4 [Candidatus Omnitrophota bacterium]